MMRNKTTMAVKLLSLILLLLSINIQPSYAAGTSFASMSSSSGSGENPGTPSPNPGEGTGELPGITIGEKKYVYQHSKGITKGTSIRVNLYDLKGKSLIPIKTTIEPEDAIKSGTWVGVNLIEQRVSGWNVTISYVAEIRKKYTCHYVYEWCATNYATGKVNQDQCHDQISGCHWEGQNYKCNCRYKTGGCTPKSATETYTPPHSERDFYAAEPDCPDTLPGNSRYEFTELTNIEVEKEQTASPPAELTAQLYGDAEAEARRYVGAASGIVEYMTNHSYYEDHVFKSIGANGLGISGGTAGQPSGGYQQDFLFTPKDVCMNFKTSQVTYYSEEEGETCNSSNGEVKLENKNIYDAALDETVEIWHYFVPLDASSKAIFPLQITPDDNNENIYGTDDCKNYMENDENNSDPAIYTQFIIPKAPESPSDPVYLFDRNKTHEENLEILESAGGCRIAINIDIPITQKFYNEIESDEKTTYKGFNFYYKPISINDPFPNGINEVSLWKQWQDEGESSPDISESYSEVTYEITPRREDSDEDGPSLSEIREHNRDNDYTNWDNINLDGSSQFIDNFVTRNNSDFYKLGCGVANTDPDNKILYIEECDG